MNLRTRLLVTLIVGILVIVPALAWFTYNAASRSVLTDTQGRLASVREVLAKSAADWFSQRRVALASLADSTQTRDALVQLTGDVEVMLAETSAQAAGALNDGAWARIGGEVRATFEKTFAPALQASRGQVDGGVDAWLPADQTGLLLQYLYAGAGGGRLEDLMLASRGERVRLAALKSGYARTVDMNEPIWASFSERLRLADLALISHSGRVVWTQNKGALLGQNLRSPRNRLTPYGQVFAAAGFLDFSPRQPAERRVIVSPLVLPEHDGDAPSFLLAAPVANGIGRRAGVIVARLSASDLDGLMDFNGAATRAGLGATGFALLVGPDGRAWNSFRFSPRLPATSTRALLGADGRERGRTTAGAWALDAHPAVRAALDPLSPLVGGLTAPDDTGAEAIWSYGSLPVMGLPAALLVAQQSDEGLRVARDLRNQTLILAVVFLVFAVAAGWLFTHRFVGPIEALAKAAMRVSAGEMDARAPVTGNDEVAAAATAFNGALETVATQKKEISALNEALNAGVAELRMVLHQVAAGDLTVRAQIQGGPVAPVASLLNTALDTLQTAVSYARSLTDLVAAEISRVIATQREVLDGSCQQAADAQRAADKIEETHEALGHSGRAIQAMMQDMETVGACADQGDVAMQELESGSTTVRRVVGENVRRIRTAAETVTTLGAKLGALGQISQGARDAALNAQLGRGSLSSVVEQVQEFARQVDSVYNQVKDTFENITTEVGHAIRAVENQVSNVEAQSRTAGQARQVMAEIRSAVGTLATNLDQINQFMATVEGLHGGLRTIAIGVVAQSETTREAASTTGTMIQGVASRAESLADHIHNLKTDAVPSNGSRNGRHARETAPLPA